ncbi:MAG: tRNA (N6-isopentenyl adenosine(37)-C2)-methylthiotransferase MiaB [Deltaproteobacteria bacterium]|nr:tRNA (N6-isopentenyl adenosine(37)-C2)-methylthiotransferase MiaB [Deltaproteobacteria bacterium]
MTDSRRARRFWFVTMGCQMNRHDSARMAESLRAAGLEPAREAGEADVCVVNTCCVREKAEQKARSAVGRLAVWKRGRAGRRVVVAGCVAERRGAAWLADFAHVDAVLGPDRLGELPSVAAAPPTRELPLVATGFTAGGPGDFLDARPDLAPPGAGAFVTISKGCAEHCTFCIVPSVRGPLRPRSAAEVVAEATALVSAGARELTLIGQVVNDYRHDGVGFADLLRRVGAVPGLLRLRYTSPHPRFVDGETARAHAELPVLCEHVHLPVQSGADEVLRRMGRRYGRDDYRRAIDLLRRARPGLTFGTDAIVGFPGETEAQLEETVALVREVGFTQVFSFTYSPRPGTPAARRPDDVPPAEKARRLQRLQEAADAVADAWRRGRVGATEEVLLETPSDRAGGTWQGRTRHNDVVHVRPAAGFAPSPGSLLRVTVEEARPHCLVGAVPAEAT